MFSIEVAPQLKTLVLTVRSVQVGVHTLLFCAEIKLLEYLNAKKYSVCYKKNSLMRGNENNQCV